MKEELKKDEALTQILKLVAPGTPLREGLENVLRARTGALIVVGSTQEVLDLIDGGFSINCDFSPNNLYELAKMDGAIILNESSQKILFANAHLNPDVTIPSKETGIRHRTAERVAKQTGQLVISISQRRNIITLFQGNIRYTLKDIGVILTKANQALQTLEKYKSVLDQGLINLSALEFEELVTLHDVVTVLQKIERVLRIKSEIIKYINELGTEGRLINMQLDELISNTEEEALDLIKDYLNIGETIEKEDRSMKIFTELKKHTGDELLDIYVLAKMLGYSGINDISEINVAPHGFRLLNKIPRLPMSIILKLVERFSRLSRILTATIEELDDVDGIGEIRARAIKNGLKRIQEQVFIERHL